MILFRLGNLRFECVSLEENVACMAEFGGPYPVLNGGVE